MHHGGRACLAGAEYQLKAESIVAGTHVGLAEVPPPRNYPWYTCSRLRARKIPHPLLEILHKLLAAACVPAGFLKWRLI